MIEELRGRSGSKQRERPAAAGLGPPARGDE
jgi:hypothetical protein